MLSSAPSSSTASWPGAVRTSRPATESDVSPCIVDQRPCDGECVEVPADHAGVLAVLHRVAHEEQCEDFLLDELTLQRLPQRLEEHELVVVRMIEAEAM